jgi:hypothetical protein
MRISHVFWMMAVGRCRAVPRFRDRDRDGEKRFAGDGSGESARRRDERSLTDVCWRGSAPTACAGEEASS